METKKNNFIKRFKSFLWRTGMMALAGLLAWGGKELELLNLPLQITAIIGLVLGEISKWLNKNAK